MEQLQASFPNKANLLPENMNSNPFPDIKADTH